MDRISALRNVEEALTAFERGEIDLRRLEERVTGTLRTYVTELDADAPDTSGRPYRVRSEETDQDVVVVADTPDGARDHAATILDVEPDRLQATPLD